MASHAKHIDEYQTPPELLVASAMHLVNAMPNSKRAEALRRVAADLRALHSDLKEPQPEWLKMLTDLAEKESSA